MTDEQPTTLSEHVADRIRYQLFLARISAAELARRAGMSQPYVSRRLTGAQPFDLADLERIASVLGVAILDLLPESSRVAPASRSDDDLNCVSVQVAAPVSDQPRHAAIRTSLRHPTRRATSSGHGRTTRRAVRLTTCASDGDS